MPVTHEVAGSSPVRTARLNVNEGKVEMLSPFLCAIKSQVTIQPPTWVYTHLPLGPPIPPVNGWVTNRTGLKRIDPPFTGARGAFSHNRLNSYDLTFLPPPLEKSTQQGC